MNKKIRQSLGMRKVIPETVGSIEREYNVHLKASNKSMELSSYMEKSGFPEMAKLLRMVEGTQTKKMRKKV